MKIYLGSAERDCERLALEFAATEKQIKAATRRATSKLGRWMKSAMLRETCRDTGVPRKALKGRLRFSVNHFASSTRLWVGRNAIPLSALNPRQTRQGVTAGAVRRDHAFIVNGQVYRRVGRERTPLAIQYRNITDEVERVLLTVLKPQAEQKYLHFFEQELKWEKVKEAKKAGRS